ncbi:MAG: tyrosine-type recombinase/integrase [Lachnospiraceae bacterium]|nr:tyrosine-type recombinase/integrase [Lachnospiraceae bacterium]
MRNSKGEGSFTVNANGSVTHRKSVGFKSNGARKILTVTCPSKAACIREMRKKEELWKQENDNRNISQCATVADLCERHLDYQVHLNELKPKSIDRREVTIQRHIADYPLGRLQIQAVTASDIEDHVNGLITEGKLSASSIDKVVDVLNAAYKWAAMRGEISVNPVLPVKESLDKRIQRLRNKTSNEADVIVLSADEEKRFVNEALQRRNGTKQYMHPAGLCCLLLLYTGMRCGEAFALRWRDVDFEHRILTIEKNRSVARNRDPMQDVRYVAVEGTTKNEKARKIMLTEDAFNILRLIWDNAEATGQDDFVITTSTGRPNTATNLEHGAATIFRKIGMPEQKGGVHIFRRTFATNMYDHGARVKEIAAYIGDLESTTERYYIAARKKRIIDGEVVQIVEVPRQNKGKE